MINLEKIKKIRKHTQETINLKRRIGGFDEHSIERDVKEVEKCDNILEEYYKSIREKYNNKNR